MNQYFERVEADCDLPNEIPVSGCTIIEYDESHDNDDFNEYIYHNYHNSNNVSTVKNSESLQIHFLKARYYLY